MDIARLCCAVLLLCVGAFLRESAASCGFQSEGCSSRSGRDRRDIVFPGEEHEDFNPITRYLTPEQIDQLNAIDSLEEVLEKFSNSSLDVEPPIVSARILPPLGSRIGGGLPGEARSEYPEYPNVRSRGVGNRLAKGRPANTHESMNTHNSLVKTAIPAKCQPTLQPVPLKKPEDLTVMYWPYCVQLERCGGCCINDRQQSCQPTKTEPVKMRVTRFLINGMVKNGSEVLLLERHVECRCSCIVKPSDCNSLQEYSPRECRCNCGNADEKRKCLSEPNKLWDYNECRCRCREYPPEGCTTGLSFDPISCSCIAVPESRRRLPDNSYKVDQKRRRRWQNRTSYSVVPPLA